MMAKQERVRITQFQYFSVMVIALFLSFLIFPGKRRMDASSALVGLIHFGSFSANFGAQLWVTLVAGLTMFYNLPRHMFGQVQSRLFPMFFLWSLVTSAVTLATYVSLNPVDSWHYTKLVQVACLVLCVVTSGVNSLLLAPIIVGAMVKTFTLELQAGARDVIGYLDMKELKENPEYKSSYRRFRRCHGLSSLLVVTSLAANGVYLYFMASQTAI